jgi:hypothetical protein
MRAGWLRAHGLDDSYYTTFHSPESSGLKCIGRWPWGPSWELAGRDTFLYLGSGSGVRILSIADSVHPRMLGQINARGLVSQVVVQDSLLFVACGSWGAQVYSVADPANPRELGSMDAVIGDVCVEDTFCYTAGDSFRIYNCANPTQPAQVAVVADSGDVIAEASGYVYVGHGSSGSGLNVYDARNPHSPTLINTLGGVQLALFVHGQRLFRTSVQPSYFQILNISVPTSIHEVGRIDGYGGVGLYADDDFAYLSCAYDHEGIFVIDITNPANPQLRDSINPEGVTEWDPYVPRTNSYGYLADDYGGLITLDLHDANSISQAWAGYQAHQAVDVVVDGHRAYVADFCAGLQILDVSDPSEPVSLGRFDTLGSKATRTATARDSFAFIGMDGITGRRFLRVLNVLDPANPTLVAQESCYNWPEDYVLRDSLLYMVEDYMFQVFNVARPREPALVGSCASNDGTYFGLSVQDTLAYIAGGPSLQVVSISNPANPYIVVGNGGRASTGVAVRDTFAYIPYPYDTLFVYSVADPSNFRLLSAVPTSVWPWDVALGESKLYVGASDGWGVDVYDLVNPGQPVRRGRASAPDDVRRLCYSNGMLYVTLWEAGVAIYETTATGIHEQAATAGKSGAFRVWPNVTSDNVRFTAGAMVKSADIAVYDVSGKRLRDVSLRVDTKGGVTEGELGLAALPAGLYIVRVNHKEADFTAKVVKTNRR